jgi:hypothetical protein
VDVTVSLTITAEGKTRQIALEELAKALLDLPLSVVPPPTDVACYHLITANYVEDYEAK